MDEEGIDMKVALRAHDAASAGGDYSEEEAIMLAKEMAPMSGVQQESIVKKKKSDPSVNTDEIVEAAKSGEKITSFTVAIAASTHGALKKYAGDESTNLNDAAGILIDEGLSSKGYLVEDE